MSRNIPERDPRSRFEDEGIPDLQDGTPEQRWAVDPQEAALPGDEPVAMDDFGTTGAEQREGESLDGRLNREVPEEQALFAAGPEDDELEDEEPLGDSLEEPDENELTPDGGLDTDPDLDTIYEREAGAVLDGAAQPSGAGWDEPRPAGRLVTPDEGAHPDVEADEVAREVGPDAGGFSAEEDAMRVDPE